MRIFTIEINGIDEENFLKLSRDEKFKWIQKHTQKDEKVIKNYLDVNFPKAISEKIKDAPKTTATAKNGSRGNRKKEVDIDK